MVCELTNGCSFLGENINSSLSVGVAGRGGVTCLTGVKLTDIRRLLLNIFAGVMGECCKSDFICRGGVEASR